MTNSDNNAMNHGNVETEISRDHQKVRDALRSLPKANCPVGFDFRLERRLAGNPVGGTRSGWSMGWLGAGVGFATAMVIAVFVFNFGSIPGVSPANVAGTPSQVKTSGAPIEQPAEMAKSNETPAQSTTIAEESEQLASKQDTSKDKTKPGTLPEGQYQTVSGSGGR
ncbi:MAG: hypothetical protein KDB65_12425 [Calditrichaeota bacterium]|nr:hypothetical protein [Calditrichota bacterium]MCB9368169.1 hypothetical protein [Calditrichota bacterium]